MSDTTGVQPVELPTTTEELLPFLQKLYPADELKAHLNANDGGRGAQRYAGKLELIDELLEIYNDQNERARTANDEAGRTS